MNTLPISNPLLVNDPDHSIATPASHVNLSDNQLQFLSLKFFWDVSNLARDKKTVLDVRDQQMLSYYLSKGIVPSRKPHAIESSAIFSLDITQIELPTPLGAAIKYHHKALLAFLLPYCASDTDGLLDTLHYLIEHQYFKEASIVLPFCTDLNRLNSKDQTPLMHMCCMETDFITHTDKKAVESRHQFIQLLLCAGANPNIQNHQGCNAFMMAASLSSLSLINLLLSKSDPSLFDHEGHSALSYAMYNIRLSTHDKTTLFHTLMPLSHLMQKPEGVSEVDFMNRCKQLLFSMTAYSPFELLLDHPYIHIFAKQTDSFGRAPFFDALDRNETASIHRLLDVSDLSVIDTLGRNALMGGLEEPVIEDMSVFLRILKSSDILHRDIFGRSALDRAMELDENHPFRALVISYTEAALLDALLEQHVTQRANASKSNSKTL